MMWRRLFRRKPTQDTFVRMICEQAAHTQNGMESLHAYMKAPSEALAQQVRAAEKDADEVRRLLIDELNRSFVTPFDREDLFALSRAIDDVLDYADTTVDEMVLLGVTPNPYLVRMVSLLRDAD